MPYKTRKVKGKGTCVYKKEGGKKVGCTKGSIKKYLAALHSNVDEEIKKENKTMRITKAELMKIIKEEIMGVMSEEEVVEEVAEEQTIEEGLDNITPENIGIAMQVLGILGPKAVLAVGAGMAGQQAFEKVMAYLEQVKAKKEMGDK